MVFGPLAECRPMKIPRRQRRLCDGGSPDEASAVIRLKDLDHVIAEVNGT
jgi:hypothetical protein